MNRNSSKSNEQKVTINDKPPKKQNQTLSYPVRKSNSQVAIKKDLKSIISHLKNEIIHISLDKTGKNSKKPLNLSQSQSHYTENENENDNSFKGKRPSTYKHIMTDVNYSISPLRRKFNENYYNELLINYTKAKEECKSLRRSRANANQFCNTITQSLSQSKSKQKIIKQSDKPKKKDKKLNQSASVTLTESNAKETLRKPIANKAENSKKPLNNKHKQGGCNSNCENFKNNNKVINCNHNKNRSIKIKEYQNEIIKLKEDNKELMKQCNEFNETILMLMKAKKEYETMLSDKNDLIEKQNKIIETLTTQNSIQLSNVQSNEKLTEEII